MSVTVRRRRVLDLVFGGAAVTTLAVGAWRFLNGDRAPSPEARLRARVLAVRVLEDDGDSRLLALETARGTLEARHFPTPGARRGAVWLPGATREWRTPARGLYPRLAGELRAEGMASLWVRYRDPASLDESVLDAAAAVAYLESEGAEVMALTGHSFGGAVAIQAAAASPSARVVVALATQAAGTGAVGRLRPRCALLLIHGEADRILRPINAAEVYRAAAEPKELLRYPNAGHTLDEVADDVAAAVRRWILEYTRPITT